MGTSQTNVLLRVLTDLGPVTVSGATSAALPDFGLKGMARLA